MAKTFYRSIDDSFDRFEVKYKETEKYYMLQVHL